MNATIANLIITRLVDAGIPWLDKYAGLVRPIAFLRDKKTHVWPIACNVVDPQACTDETLKELLPLEKYTSIVFVEGDTYPTRVKNPAMGVLFEANLRLVVWINCSKVGGACGCGDQAAQDVIAAVEKQRTYSADPVLNIKHVVMGGVTRGRDVFGKYTLDESRSQYLHYPFDYFALDIKTEFRVVPGCEDQLDGSDVSCWAPPSIPLRRYPDQFTCEELIGERGLTETQIACLDCVDGGDCDPLGYDLHNSLDEVILSGMVNDPCGGTLELTAHDAEIELVDAKGGDLGTTMAPSGKVTQITAPSATVQLQDSNGENLGAPITVHAGASEDIEAPDTTIQLQDSAGANIGSADVYPAGTTTTKTAPDASIQRKDSAGADIGSPLAAKSNGSLNVTCPDGVVTIKNQNGDTLGTQAVKSNGTANYTAPIPLKFAWGAGNADTLTFTVTADEAGTYATFTNDGSSGTITYSKNGGSYAALSGSLTLAVSDTITVRRTITTSAGWSTWAL